MTTQADRKVIDLYYDIPKAKLVMEDGSNLKSDLIPPLHYQEQALIRLQLYDGVDAGSGEPIEYSALTSGLTLSAAMDDDWDADTGPLTRTLSTGMNVVGDWKDGGTADVTKGQISIRMDCYTQEVQQALAATEYLAGNTLEVQGRSPLGLVFAISFDMRLKNLIDRTDDDPPEEELSDYFTKAESDARYVQDVLNGQISIASGEQTVTVSGLGLDAVPEVILLTLLKPGQASDNLFAMVDGSSMTTDGFTAVLSAPTKESGYVLMYKVMFAEES